MKKKLFLKATFLFVLGLALVTSCSKDDDGGDRFAGVPKGEIVPVGERYETLTGFPEGEGRGSLEESSQVWWKQVQSKIDYHCGGYEDEDLYEEDFYIAFKPDGLLYAKYGSNGQEFSYYSWEWKDDNKEAILMEGETFEIRELNDGGIVYASRQEQSSDCYAITWEQFSN
ncbi:hypothetical protein DVK85_05870 [Flavobacterium arcticum]|uniref:Lipocalin-like domain-containing protein n=1 Tax=Flavobacterium arcticum TaxID=1784713 RepID=A0A345HB27_9FLAO|nr:hypothetical protein [Flavobacterium arcticum]AXG73787.1 hypothetical protein DVK85_05870 [Flavobacterium arcticum]KAF2511739.1 hypothetical protein E0W72_05380 [Flavobacterium arcticum]